jgi:formylglycine-generating enzyme required for sulfatase activity
MTGRIFINYRRADTQGFAHSLHMLLEPYFGKERVFMDVDRIRPGKEFVQVLEEAVSSCEVMLVLIGRWWLEIKDEAGNRRLDNPQDYVRIEIQTALKRNVSIIPILVGGARMPSSLELPDDLKPLVRRQAFPIGDRLRMDTERLIKEIELTFEELEVERERERQERLTRGEAEKGAEDKKDVELKTLEQYRGEMQLEEEEGQSKHPVHVQAKDPQPQPSLGELLGPYLKRIISNIPRRIWSGLGISLAVGMIGGVLGMLLFGGEIAGMWASGTPLVTETATLTSTESETQTPTFVSTGIATDTLMPTEEVGSTLVDEKNSVEMVLIPAGEFEMGSEDGDGDESPVHTVYLDTYWIDKYEVTNSQYAAFLNAMGNQEEGGVTWLDDDDKYVGIHRSGEIWSADSGYDDHPVVEVSWHGATAYCEWVGGRLPTEAEWEKAARGGLEGQTYPWGDAIPTCLQGTENGAQSAECTAQLVEVGSFTPNGYGLFDMVGNVKEWVADWYDDTYYSSSPSVNPVGPSSGTYRVLRGGSWYSYRRDLKVFGRENGYPNYTFHDGGFRCAMESN